MSDDLPHSPRRLRRQQKLVELLKAKGGPTQVALDIGTPRSHISAMALGTRGVGDKIAAKLEERYNLPTGWFDQTKQSWPFKIDADRFLTLNDSDRELVERRLLEVIELCELRHITTDEARNLTVTGSSQHGTNAAPTTTTPSIVDELKAKKNARREARRVPQQRSRRGPGKAA